MPRIVLIVEDVETCASTLEIVFSGIDGIDIVAVLSGEQALALLKREENEVVAIVTDLQMRGMDGYELIEEVRSDPRYVRVPIMVITGSPDPETPERVRRLGATALFAKPYSPVLVRQKLEELLKNDTPFP